MNTNLENFSTWYVHVLSSLYEKRDAGIAVLMISLPLLERYLRRRYDVAWDNNMSDAALDGLRSIFPALQDVAHARKFWQVYRNGFLHQATVSSHTRGGALLPDGWLTHDIAEPVRIEPDSSFTVNPVLFSRAVISAITNDFGTFEAGAPSLPQVARRDPVTIPSTYLGTGSTRP